MKTLKVVFRWSNLLNLTGQYAGPRHLRKFIVKHIHEVTLKDEDELFEELDNAVNKIKKELFVDFIGQRGETL
ncbi:MAG: hypothetical protein P4L35_04530 [Ignavibacteriaceae bacterium]|nr:hypothetical protein [Ignavibacteriaceae bacterium]